MPSAIVPQAFSRAQRVRAIVAASSGNLVEWFDFYTYAFCSIYFAGAFFPQGDATAQLLQSATVFALGFLMRPLGGWIFGRLADIRGRRDAMMLSILLMCAGSLMIACLPTYAAIGAAAPALLLVARLLQGLSVGGEYGSSATYMSEVGLQGQRGFFASFHYVTLIGGQLLALLVVVMLEACIDDRGLHAWGWRIPFALGGITAAISLAMRRNLPETAAPAQDADVQAGSMRALLQHKAALISVVGYTAGGSLAFYTCTTYMQKYLVNTVGFATRTASIIMTVSVCVFMLLQPVFGMLSDRFGRRRMMYAFGLSMGLGIYPAMTALRHAQSPCVAAAWVILTLVSVSCYTSIAGLIKAEVFPAHVRALGVGLSYAVGNAAFGGTAELVALQCKAAGFEAAFFIYVAGMCLVGLLFSRQIPRPGAGMLET